MKRILYFALLYFCAALAPAHALEDGRTAHGPFVRFLIVEGRGISNLGGFPLEFGRTAVSEYDTHRRLWPLTYFPRVIANIGLRLASSVNDILLYPWVVPFTNDISPWTEPFGLPDYPWQWLRGNY